MNDNAKGHLAAFLTIGIWGLTFISTKILLAEFTPIEILFIRFLLGFLMLFAINPRKMRGIEPKEELLFAGAGLTGICLYYLLENIALTYTMASNVSVIISTAPFFTVMLSKLFLKEEGKTGISFYAGFLLAMAGIALLSYSGSMLSINPIGDVLALTAAFAWGIYSVLTKKISHMGFSVVQTTRRIFFYGILFMIPFIFFFGFDGSLSRLAQPAMLLNMLFLGFAASAFCFVSWNLAVKLIGAVKSSIYIYLTPLVTVAASVLILGEQVTWMSALGALLTVSGLVIPNLAHHS